MVNYQFEMDKLIQSFGEKRPTLLLHSCCGPCSSYVLEYLSKYFNITVLYYNPNITEDKEYNYRLSEQKRLIKEGRFSSKIKIIDSDYDPALFLSYVKGLEKEPEGGKRCEKCFRLRLEYCAEICKSMGFDYFTTTLTVSPHKNAGLINKIGSEVGGKYGCTYLPSDFKKKNGYKRSIELSKEYNLYRQNFCGCIFSKAARRYSDE